MKLTKNYTIADAFKYYLSTMPMADRTRINFESTRAKVEDGKILNKSISEANAAVIRKFLNKLTGSPSYVHLTYTQLKTVISRFVKDHNLKDTPNIDGILKTPKKEEVEEGAEEYLTFKEVKNLLSLQIDVKELAYVRDLFVITCFTGMAIADLVQFTTDWISADENKNEWLVYQRQKTKKAKRKCRVPILPIARKLIFSHSWPTKLAKRTIQYHCGRLGNLIGKPITPHTGRHSFGVIMLYFGFSMESVREMMGHASMQTTEKIYAKVSKEKIEREMKNILSQMENYENPT
jgi:site-specific recombinase XerD